MNEMRVNDIEIYIYRYEIKQRSLVNTGDISPKIADEYRLRRKRTIKVMCF